MIGLLVRLLGGRMVHKVIENRMGGNSVDAKLGFALLRDGRVPLKSKVLAFGLGAAITALLMAFELPLEALITFLLPFLGVAELPFDGLEMIAGPVLFGSLLLPRLAPAHIVARIHAERNGTVLDVEPVQPTTPASNKRLSLVG